MRRKFIKANTAGRGRTKIEKIIKGRKKWTWRAKMWMRLLTSLARKRVPRQLWLPKKEKDSRHKNWWPSKTSSRECTKIWSKKINSSSFRSLISQLPKKLPSRRKRQIPKQTFCLEILANNKWMVAVIVKFWNKLKK